MLNKPGSIKNARNVGIRPGPRSGPGLRAALSVLQELGQFQKCVSGHESMAIKKDAEK